MKITAIFVLVALLSLASVSSASSPPRRYCSKRCYKWRPKCGKYCRPTRTTCRMAVTVRRCRYVRRKWGKKKICKKVHIYRKRRGWKCRTKYYKPRPTYIPYPPFKGCANKCKPWKSLARKGCNPRYCHIKSCSLPYGRARAYGRKYGWGCYSSTPTVPTPLPTRPPSTPFCANKCKPWKSQARYGCDARYCLIKTCTLPYGRAASYGRKYGWGCYSPKVVAPTVAPPTIAPTVTVSPALKCFKGCLPLAKARHACNPVYCAVRPCVHGRYVCLPKLPATATPSPSPTPSSSPSPAAGMSATPTPSPAVSKTPSPTPSPCESLCYPKNLSTKVKADCAAKAAYCRFVACATEGTLKPGVGCIPKA